jgi:hypothetical protein
MHPASSATRPLLQGTKKKEEEEEGRGKEEEGRS